MKRIQLLFQCLHLMIFGASLAQETSSLTLSTDDSQIYHASTNYVQPQILQYELTARMALNCPDDFTVGSDECQSTREVYYEMGEPNPEVYVLNQFENFSNNGGLACNGNFTMRHARFFDLAEYNIVNDFEIYTVGFHVSNVYGSEDNVSLNLYILNSFPVPFSSFPTPIHTQNITVPSSAVGSLYYEYLTDPVIVPAGSKVLYELIVNGSSTNYPYLVGYYHSGTGSPSYLYGSCNQQSTYQTPSFFGYPNLGAIMNLAGTTIPAISQTAGLPSGSSFPIGTTTNIFEYENQEGEIFSCQFDVNVEENCSFITTWKTDNPGTSNNTSITIPTAGAGYNYDVDWDNDGVFDQMGITGNVTHDFGTAGTYTIRIRGDFPRIFFNVAGDRNKILSIDQWGDINWSSMKRAFAGCTNLEIDASDIPNLSNVTDMSSMFYQASSMNAPIGNWDVSNVQNMRSLFTLATSFDQDIGNWNVSNVTIMSSMFNTTPFNQDLSGWDVGNVTDMAAMFLNAHGFNQNIGNWNVSNVNNMFSMFRNAISFDQDIGNWNVSNVTSMAYMFFNASSFNQDIGNWNVSNVTDMSGMFTNAASFNQDISTWEVENVNSMFQMFLGATSFDQNLGNWNVQNVTNMSQMFHGVTLSTPNYDSLLIGWNSQNLQPNVNFHGGNSQYCEGAAARANMIANDGWSITDGGAVADIQPNIANLPDVIEECELSTLTAPTAIACDGQTITAATTTAFPITAQGTTEITWTYEDGHGNVASQVQFVMIEDTTPPSITCPDDVSVIATSASGAVVNFTEPSGIDNCSGVTTQRVTTLGSGDTFPIGEHIVTYLVTDVGGNSAQCSFTVTVQGVAPQIVCPAGFDLGNDMGECGRVVDFTVSETVGIPASTITYSHQPGDFFPVGTTTVTVTATNAIGSSSCTFDVIISDDELPEVSCQDITVQLGHNGFAPIIVSDIENESDDNCGILYKNLDITLFDCSDIGENLVTLTVEDIHGNVNQCTAVVTVEDNIPPVFLAYVFESLQNTDTGSCFYTVQGIEFDPFYSDNCDEVILTNNLTNTDSLNGYELPLGTNIIIWTLDDQHGQTTSIEMTVNVVDNESPTITCVEETLRSTDIGSCDYTVVGNEFDPAFADNCEDAFITNNYNGLSTLAGAVFPQGTTLVTWTVDDGHGYTASCNILVSVEDNEAPVVNCLTLQVQLDEFGNGSISEDDIDGDSTDNCGIASITLSQLDFDCADIGGDLDELIISEYVDGTGNDDCIEIFNGTGSDIELSAGSYTLNFYVDGSSTPTYEIPLLGTIADRDVYVVCNPFGPGAGEADQTGAFAIDGNDAIALVHDGNAVDVFGEIGVNPGSGWSNGGVSTAGTTLVRDQDVLQGNINSFVANLASEWNQFAQNNVSDVGSHTIEITDLANNVILTVTDTSGNVSTCEGNVTVIDSVAPEALCQNITVQLDANGNATVAPSQVDNGSNDACGIAGLALDQTEFDCSHIGQTNTVVLTVTDSNGNTATCTATVTVEDNVAPSVVTQDITVQLDANGNASIVASDVDDGSSDACGVATLTVSPNTFTCANVGGNTVTLTAVDVNGNSASANATVTVEDNVAPTAVCNAITVQLDASGNYTLDTVDVGDIANGSSDACGIASLSVSPNSFGCDDIGSNTVTLTVTDNNGNVSTCSTTVTVNGVVPSVTITQGPLPDFCQGAVVVLTANSDDAISFLWSTGETTQSIEVAGNGTYSVTVTSSTNCTASASYTVSGFDAGALISSYTILANSEVFLHGNNLVQSGAVGATADNGIIKLHQASTIVGRGQAANFSLNQGSTIGTQVNQPANPTIPAFMFNTQSTTASPNVTVSAGQTQTLTGSVYNIVTVRQDATVIFTQSDVYINELRTFENATISFTGCTNVYLNEKFMLARGGTVNEEGYNVVFYVDGDVQIEQGSYVRARIHTNGNEILAKGANATGNGNGNNAAQPTYMVGLFIANRVHGNKNVIWNADDVCEPCPASGSAVPPVADNGSFRVDGFGVTAWPNPSDTEFSIRVKSEDMATKVTIEVFDMNNKKVHSDQFAPTETFRFGKELQGGVYIVKVTQNGNSETERLVKY